jgi:predicted ArsR family transcriptional regulator
VTKSTLALSAGQLKLMSFGPRRDIIGILADEPDLSTREIADRLHRSPTALYRHMELLIEAGLVRQSSLRSGVKRPEAVFALTAHNLSAAEATGKAEGRAALAQAAKRYAAAASRRFSKALENGAARPNGQDANIALSHLDLQLDQAGLRELQRLLQDFLKSAAGLRDDSRRDQEKIAVTILVAPTRRRGR